MIMSANSFAAFLENAAMALLLMLALLVSWVILKRMTSAMRKGVIAAESVLIDGLTVSVQSRKLEVCFIVPEGWGHACDLTVLNDARDVLKTLHAGSLHAGEHSFSCDLSDLDATFLSFKTEGQTLERRLR